MNSIKIPNKYRNIDKEVIRNQILIMEVLADMSCTSVLSVDLLRDRIKVLKTLVKDDE